MKTTRSSGTAAVLVLEAWMKMARPGEALDMTEPPSEAFERREVVALTGETVQHCKRKLLPIIRSDAGGFFGFGEHVGPKLDNFEGRFAQLLPPKQPSAEGIELARAMLAAIGVTEERLRGNAGRNAHTEVIRHDGKATERLATGRKSRDRSVT